VALVLHHAGGHGWEMFVPPSDSNEIDRTLDDAALALGTEGCAGMDDTGPRRATALRRQNLDSRQPCPSTSIVGAGPEAAETE
jgi:hypothetical protein